jgi:hypothetical protein
MVLQELQIRFRLDFRFGFRILTSDPEWTNFFGLKEKTQDTAFLNVGIGIGDEYSGVQSGHFLVISLRYIKITYLS